MSEAPGVTQDQSPFASWRIEHVGLRLPDFDAAALWYAEKLDFRVTHSWSMGEKVFGFLVPPGNESFSIEFVAGGEAEARPAFEDLPSSHKLLGWHHVCFRVSDVQDTVAELKRRGVSILSEPRDNPAIRRRFAFFTDPWGNLIEVIQPIEDAQ